MKKAMGLGGVGKTVTVHRPYQIIITAWISPTHRDLMALKLQNIPVIPTTEDDHFSRFISSTGCVLCYIAKGCVMEAIGMGGIGKTDKITANIYAISLLLSSQTSRQIGRAHV